MARYSFTMPTACCRSMGFTVKTYVFGDVTKVQCGACGSDLPPLKDEGPAQYRTGPPGVDDGVLPADLTSTGCNTTPYTQSTAPKVRPAWDYDPDLD